MTETANVVVQADGFVDQKSFVSGMRLLVRVGVGLRFKRGRLTLHIIVHMTGVVGFVLPD